MSLGATEEGVSAAARPAVPMDFRRSLPPGFAVVRFSLAATFPSVSLFDFA